MLCAGSLALGRSSKTMTGYKSPPRRRTLNIPSTGVYANLDVLAERYRGGASWAAIGAEIKVPGIVVYRAVVRQQFPRNRRYRKALGLVKPPKLPTPKQKRLLAILGILHGA